MKVVIKPNGDSTMVYNDKIIVDKLGKREITRASNVEFNADTRKWEARLPDGTPIAADFSRDQTIKEEIAYLEERLHLL